jgi:hypothetical protein
MRIFQQAHSGRVFFDTICIYERDNLIVAMLSRSASWVICLGQEDLSGCQVMRVVSWKWYPPFPFPLYLHWLTRSRHLIHHIYSWCLLGITIIGRKWDIVHIKTPPHSCHCHYLKSTWCALLTDWCPTPHQLWSPTPESNESPLTILSIL